MVCISKGEPTLNRNGVAIVGSVALLWASLAWGQETTDPAKKTATLDALKADIEALKPARHVWREIPWKTCPLEALKASREQNKPIIAWVFLGIPTDERC
jgi:hypothetical protein